jgi:hypothetical protein
MLITQTSHPTVFKAFRLVEYDNGTINRDSPAKDAYKLNKQQAFIDQAELELEPLSDDDLETMCSGEVSEIRRLVKAHKLRTAHALLEYFFKLL